MGSECVCIHSPILTCYEMKMALKMFFKTVILRKIPYFVYPKFDGYLDRVRVRVKGSGTRGFGYRVTRDPHPTCQEVLDKRAKFKLTTWLE